MTKYRNYHKLAIETNMLVKPKFVSSSKKLFTIQISFDELFDRAIVSLYNY
ncbi:MULTISPECIES: hypothetical protein [unclassified Microcoleus]|uniref:hypothetical protein n=1 Tax=unclassified Microcoleus TaxID=2642155 RepID=UPI002FD3BC53